MGSEWSILHTSMFQSARDVWGTYLRISGFQGLMFHFLLVHCSLQPQANEAAGFSHSFPNNEFTTFRWPINLFCSSPNQACPLQQKSWWFHQPAPHWSNYSSCQKLRSKGDGCTLQQGHRFPLFLTKVLARTIFHHKCYSICCLPLVNFQSPEIVAFDNLVLFYTWFLWGFTNFFMPPQPLLS